MSVQEDWSKWERHADGSGRAFVANRMTRETKWVWQKWAVNGRVFCVNIISKERIWQEDMSPELCVAAGIPPPPQTPPSVQQKPTNRPRREPASTITSGLASDPALYREPKRARVDSEKVVNRITQPPHQYTHHQAGSITTALAYSEAARAAAEGKIAYAGPHSQHVMSTNGSSHPWIRSDGVSSVTSRFSQPAVLPGRNENLNYGHSKLPITTQSNFRGSSHTVSARMLANGNLNSNQSIPSNAVVATKASANNRHQNSAGLHIANAAQSQRRNTAFTPRGQSANKVLGEIRKVVEDVDMIRFNYERMFSVDVTCWKTRDEQTSVGTAENGDVVVGTCQNVSKMFLRLTSAPKPSEVRPLQILKLALKMVKNSWRNQEHDYEWACSQLKSIRQDMKVQHIETVETLDVYETHARIALENQDFGEFNTCLAQLSELYTSIDRVASVRDEFASYRVLYNLLVGANQAEYAKMLLYTSREERSRPGMAFAIRVRNVVLDGNFHAFFFLYLNPPPRSMALYLMDPMVDYIRSRAICTLCHAYSPGYVPLSFVAVELAWFVKESPDDSTLMNKGDHKIGKDVVFLDLNGRLSSQDDDSAYPVDVDAMRLFCGEIGAVLVPSEKEGPIPLALDTKASKASGVHLKECGRGLITAAGSR